MADWGDILKTVRRYTGDNFRPERGYSKSTLNFGRRMALLKYYRKIEELTIYGAKTYEPKRGEKAELFRLTGQTGYKLFTKAILKVPTPNAKVKVTIDKSRPKGSRVVIEDTRPRHKTQYLNIPPEVLMYAIRRAEEDGELPGEYIEQVLDEYAPEAQFFMVRSGDYYAWGAARDEGGQHQRIGEIIYKYMNQYGADKFDPDDPNSHYFGNWFNGITAFTEPEDAFPIIREGAARRSRYLFRSKRSPSTALDKYRVTKDNRVAKFHNGEFVDYTIEGANHAEYREGWNAYKAGKIMEDNPYRRGTIEYTRWIRGFAQAEEIVLSGHRINRR